MKRGLEPIDLVVAVGLFATVFGGYLMFVTTTGAFQTADNQIAASGSSPTLVDAIQWVQPALGQAIVDDAVLEWDMTKDLAREVRALNRISMTDQWLRSDPLRFVEHLRAYAAGMEREHTARMQWVMGRAIVTGTARGLRSGAVSPQALDSEFNRRLINQALLLAGRMDEAFRVGHQEHLGSMIMTAAQDYHKAVSGNQERLGQSVVAVTGLQEDYITKREGLQAQLASAAIAAIHGEQIADRFAHLAASEFGVRPPAATVTEPRTWPEVPATVYLAASLALIGLFIGGMMMPMARPSRPMEEPKLEEEKYRKTA
jgi:hypothetical protein